jgi:hypothetical protein
MKDILTENQKAVEEKQQPITIKNERILLGYPGKDGYCYQTKEEALAATCLKMMV